MELNADFSKSAIVHSDQIEWLASPMAGVDRRMLERIGDEVARATTIVRYAPDSKFSAHVHSGGEEFIVLDGVFQDEYGDYPAGSYIRNPPTSSHTPGSAQGCTIFVKLWQFEPNDRTQVKIDMNKMHAIESATREGVSIMPLFQDTRETVQMEIWDANAQIDIDMPDGGELLVLEGNISTNSKDIPSEQLTRHDWLRIPIGKKLNAMAGKNGAKVWVKMGHIPYAKAPNTI